MTLSACMIVKNEERVLERCLASIKGHVDELVIVDTGSTDRTLEIARQYADVLDEIEWPGDFSAARNHSMSLATGDFLFIIDADEFVHDTEGFHSIRLAMETPGLIAGHVSVLNTLKNALIEGERVWQLRLLKNDPAIRYEGLIHNQIGTAVGRMMKETGGQVVHVGTTIIHDGYDKSGKDAEAKYSERIPILKQQIEESRTEGQKAYYQFQLGSMLQVMGKIEDAAEVWKVVDYDKLDPFNAFYAHYVAAKAFRDIGHKAKPGPVRTWNYAMALRMANAMMGINSREPAAYFIAGVLLLETENDRPGLMLLMESLIRAYMKDQHRRFEMDKRGLLENIAVAFRNMGNEMAAEGVEALDPAGALYMIQELQAEFVEVDEEIFA